MTPDGKDELHLVPMCVLEFYVGVTHCPEGAAEDSNELSNRGHTGWPEITCWPRHEAHLSTGREYKSIGVTIPQPTLNEDEKRICAILGLQEWELSTFMHNWRQHTGGIGTPKPKTVEQVKRELLRAR